MKWKIIRNFIFIIVFVVILVVIINIIFILYVILINSFFKVVDFGNNFEEFVCFFEKDLYEKDGEFKLFKIGVEKLEKLNFWI